MTDLVYPEEITPALEAVLGLHPGDAINLVGAMREVGFVVAPRYENENAAVRHFLIPFALKFGERWRDEAIADLMRRAVERGADPG